MVRGRLQQDTQECSTEKDKPRKYEAIIEPQYLGTEGDGLIGNKTRFNMRRDADTLGIPNNQTGGVQYKPMKHFRLARENLSDSHSMPVNRIRNKSVQNGNPNGTAYVLRHIQKTGSHR